MGKGRCNWTTDDLEKGLQRIAGGQVEKPSRAKNKYNAVPKVYNGVKYHSTKEANYARALDSCMNQYLPDKERVVKWERQIPYSFDMDGLHICKYILDFCIHYADGHVRYVDVKGKKGGVVWDIFQIKKRLMKVCHQIEVEVV